MTQDTHKIKQNEAETKLTHLCVPQRVVCPVCQKTFQQGRWWQIVCSKKCAKERKKNEDQESKRLLRESKLRKAQNETQGVL
ncbi:MAG: hypothetical protein COS89_09290 [Deltaproteobacteria bacterium CG07_land_8_20_14_0_80_38_7]|nr:MAG: hypothetical protein COS89_09290 [Deltaproteobacteria bacterium CG07_land_8_20_14_0_80_38_7]